MLKKALRLSIMVHLSSTIFFLAKILYRTLSSSCSISPPEKNNAKKFQLTYSSMLLMILLNFSYIFSGLSSKLGSTNS